MQKNIHFKKITPFCLGTFQIQLLGEEIWDKTTFFQDKSGYSKHSSKKMTPLFFLEFIKGFFHSVCFPPPPS